MPPKPASDNNIPPSTGAVEEWVPLSIALRLSEKLEIRAAAAREGLKVSRWGRKVLMAALDNERRSGEDRRRTA